MHAGVLSCRLCLVSGTVQVTGYRPEWARVEHGLLLRLDIAHRCWKHAWFWLWPSCARKAAMATPYSNESFVPTTSWRTRRKFHSRKISTVLKVSVSLCCKRTCIKAHVQLEMQIRSVNTASSGTRICSQPSRTLDTGDIFIPEEETISKLNRYMEFTDVSPLRCPLSCSSKTKKNFSKKEAERNRKQSKFDQGSVLFLGEPTALGPQGTVLTTALNGRETWGKPTKSLHLIKSAYNSWHCCQQTWGTKNPGCHAKFIKVHDSQGTKLTWEERRADSPRFTSEVLFKPSRWMQTAKKYYTKDEYKYNRVEKRKTLCAFLLMVKSSTCPEYLTHSIREDIVCSRWLIWTFQQHCRSFTHVVQSGFCLFPTKKCAFAFIVPTPSSTFLH